MTNPLATRYLGLELPSPLVVGSAAPLSLDLDRLEQLQEEGAGAVVLRSLCLDQGERDWQEWLHHQRNARQSHPEAESYLPCTEPLHLGLDGYLEEIRSAQSRLLIPVIASLNGCHGGPWVEASQAVQRAGAHAIELNLYTVPSQTQRSSAELEDEQIQIVQQVTAAVSLPVAVKLSPWYTALASMAQQFSQVGAQSLVLFNRFYQPNVNIETLETVSQLDLSSPVDQRLALRWIGLLYQRVPLAFAASGGVATGDDVVRMVMVGAQVTHVVSALLRHGPGHLQRMRDQLLQWLEQHRVERLSSLRGSLSLLRCPDPEAFERAQYWRAISSYSLPREQLI
ncbi:MULTISPECIES: dihydroorotate dehydrogenase-like protein [unclassified Synechococcus]|jgi:dihydroorotate dehydrogenase (fumarate)|uniref:dihydroorotate dehydrogenase-like protein n=1 Tax=unclassified Synechococcus TaxID=2626047 RepID=UPI00200191FF|nr:dihydroorotate dehydrogenase-like protein [Synechococcus sp. A10-1-5-1]UPM50879.1 dihydroorotate dehydrogenase-like protein [Synechococcus sp. A10-1-5-1]